jgi:acetyl-CoA acetyltransferase
MREVAVVSFAQSATDQDVRNEVEIVMPVAAEAIEAAGLTGARVDFTVSGSSDYLQGTPFAFVMALDAVGAWPPICESHVEMDGAFALYEAWIKLQTGEIDTALVYSFGKATASDLSEVLSRQLDPYCVAPLWPDAISLGALQARAYLEASGRTEKDLAEVAVRCRSAARDNPHALVSGTTSAEALLASPCSVSPLHEHDCAIAADGAAAVVLAAGDRARELCERPAWICGIDHRIEPHSLGVRELAKSRSAEQAAARAGAGAGAIDVAELHALFTHEELLLCEALGLGDEVDVNPSGGALVANPMMATGLIRIGEVARRIHGGSADRGLAHAAAGPCLQQNLVCVLEGR